MNNDRTAREEEPSKKTTRKRLVNGVLEEVVLKLCLAPKCKRSVKDGFKYCPFHGYGNT